MSIILNDIWLTDSKHKKKYFLEGASYEFRPGRNVGFLMQPGENRATLMRCLYGALRPAAGAIHRTSRVSWPLQWGHGLTTTMTGKENLHFLARIYERSLRKFTAQVAELAEITDILNKPLQSYAPVERQRLNFIACISIPFDFYLGEEGVFVGNTAFVKKCEALVAERMKGSAFIIFARNPVHFKRYAPDLLHIREERLENFATLEEATDYFNREIKAKA